MDFCHHGDLHHYLRRTRLVPAGDVQHLAHQILEGLDQMHQNDFAHRDLKPGVRIAENCKWLLTSLEHPH
jgi:serine/threonine protein kinase